MNLLLRWMLVLFFASVVGYIFGFGNGYYEGYFHGYDEGEIWDSGYSNGFVSGYEEAIIWYPVYSKDIYIRHYNNSVWNWENGTSAEESFREPTQKYYERRK